MIEVTKIGEGDPMRFHVVVSEGSMSTHEVTMSNDDYERLAHGRTPDQVIEAAFRFLLEREPKESILHSFDLSVIGRYFPEFERTLPDYL